MSNNSYKLNLKKIENTLTMILSEIDKENKRELNFE